MTGSLDYSLALLARLDLLIRRQVLEFRLQQAPRGDDEFRGLYISDEEVDALLDGTLPAASLLATSPAAEADALGQLDSAQRAVAAQIAALEAGARERGETLRLLHLADLFDLTEFEQQVLLIALAPELDLKYERLFAYLQDDVTKKRPTVSLVMRLLCPTVPERIAARSTFEPTAPLLKWELVTLHDDPNARKPVLLARYLKLDERIAGYLLGSDSLDPRLVPFSPAAEPQSDLILRPAIRERLDGWGRAWPRIWSDKVPVVLLHGMYGTGKRAAAQRIAQALDRPLLLLHAGDLAASDLSLARACKLAEREALLRNAVLAWAEAGPLLQPPQGAEPDHRLFTQALAETRVPTLLFADKAWEPARELGNRPFLRLELPEPSFSERRDLWAQGLVGVDHTLTEVELGALAGKFRLTAGQIVDAVARARTYAWARDPQNGHLQADDIDAACRSQAQHRLGSLARKLEPRYIWEDIVLPRAQLGTLKLICTTVRHRPTVYGDWGFDRKLSLGKGLISLFSGPSGTGKTMAAEIIAHTLGLDVYKIDLSAVVSKYIGETEKNLERIFAEAQGSDAILFFDEADALFGKRSEVKDAHDRYANIEVAYLLQRTEEYNGLVILASNIKKNMDEAFVRRIHFMVDFPFPEEPERLEIWKRTFPPAAPRAGDIDLPFLAKKFKITGGNIRNIILTSAFLAAEDAQSIGMRHLVRGAAYEFQKMGKLIVESDFESYFEMVRGQVDK